MYSSIFEGATPSVQGLHSVSPEVERLFIERGELVFSALQSWRHMPISEGFTAVTSKDLQDPTLGVSFVDVKSMLNIDSLLYAPVTSSWMPSMFMRSWNKSTDETYNKDRKHRLFSIIALCWYLDKVACTQEKVFAISRGSWTVIEAQHNILEYLTDYVRLVTGHPNPKDLAFVFTQSNFAYRRDPNLRGSSHHAGRSPQSQFGIDMRLEADQGVLKLLPYGHTHILFSQIVHPFSLESNALLTFIKMEPLGIGSVVAALWHGINFIESKRYVEDTARREKDVPAFILEKYIELMGVEANDCQKLIIAEMCFNIEAKSSDLLRAFIDFCIENSVNEPKNRTGNEVVLDLCKPD